MFLVSVFSLSSLGVFPKPSDLVKKYAPNTFLSRNFPQRIPYDDKIAHFFLMGALSFFVNLSLSLSQVTIGNIKILKGSLIILVIITIEEFSQKLFPSRSFTWSDLLSGYAGIFCFGRVAMYLMNHRASLEPKLPRVIAALIWKPKDRINNRMHH